MKKLRTDIYGVQKAQAGLNKQQLQNIESTGIFSTQIGMLRNAFAGAKAGALLFVTSLKTLRRAMMATGIGALLIAITSLVSYFTQTKRGVELIDRASAALGATWSVLVDRASAMGEAIVKAVSNPKQLIIDLGNLIKDNIINRFEAFGIIGKSIIKILDGDLKEGFKELGQGALQLGIGVEDVAGKLTEFKDSIVEVTAEIKEETTAAYSLERALQKVVDREREASVERSQVRAQIKELNKIAEDVTASYEDRANAAQLAIQIEQKLLAEQISIAAERVRITQEQNALGESLAEDMDREADAQIQLNALTEQSIELQTTLTNKLNIIRAQETADKEKKLAESLLEAEQQAQLEAEEMAKRDARLLESQAVLEQYMQENKLASIENGKDRALAELMIQEQNELKKVQGLENSERIQSEIKKKYSNAKLRVVEQEAKMEKDIRRSNAQSAMAMGAQILNEASSNMVEGSREWKATKKAETLITGATAAINAYNAMAGITAVGPVLGAAAAAAVGIFTLKKVNKIESTPLPGKKTYAAPKAGYAEGGFTGSGFGSADESGYKPAGIVHQDEWVAPKWMVEDSRFADTIGMLETARRSVTGYQTGGKVAPPSNMAADQTINKLTVAVNSLTSQLKSGIYSKLTEDTAESIGDIIKERDGLKANATFR